MDLAGIEKAFLIAAKVGSKYEGFTDQVPDEEVAGVVKEYPDRFYGMAGIDPLEGMEGVRALERAVKELGFIGAHVYPPLVWAGAGPPEVLSLLREMRRVGHSHPDAGRTLPHLHRRPSALQEPRTPHPIGYNSLRLPRAQASGYPHRMALGGGDDLRGLEAPQRIHRVRRLRTPVTGSPSSSTLSTPGARRRSSSAPTSQLSTWSAPSKR